MKPEAALRRLFLLLFLRGRGARGLNRKAAPTSVGQKLALTLFFYALVGCNALLFQSQSVFALAAYLSAMTFVFLGMFVASSAGEILFNREEADILLHRPITPRTMLWAKIRVLVEVSLWLAGAFNLAGFYSGLNAPDGGWRFPIVHAISVTMSALFCTGGIVLMYQLCLRWFGRERLEGVMTTAQVLVSIAVVLSGQILPQVLFKAGKLLTLDEGSWWIGLLPPAWFAGFDDAFAGSAAPVSFLFASIAVAATAVTLWLAFGKLAQSYETGLQAFNETISQKQFKATPGRRWLNWLVGISPLRWWLRDPVSRASFLLTAAYLVRDRDLKLRLYPGIAPMMMLPFLFLFDGKSGQFGIAFAGGYLGLIPLIALGMVQHSQQWQASDLFRSAPLAGPGAICHGARRAILVFLALPAAAITLGVVLAVQGLNRELLLLVPGLIALPVYALWPAAIGHCVPLSKPTEEAKAAGRSLAMFLIMMISMGLSGLSILAWSGGWFGSFLAVEACVAIGAYLGLRGMVGNLAWETVD
jgi:hypothetical protein